MKNKRPKQKIKWIKIVTRTADIPLEIYNSKGEKEVF